jgi:hypothetical protein
MEKSIEWYSNNFGFTIIDRSEIPGTDVRVAHMQGVGFILEIFEEGEWAGETMHDIQECRNA